MATSRKTGLRHADLPAVDAVRFSDAATSRAWEQVRQILNVRHGKAGQEIDRSVTFGDLVEMGMVSMRTRTGKQIAVKDPSGPFLPVAPPVVDGIPPAPTGVTVTPALSTIIIEWDKPAFGPFGYAEVFRSTTNNLAAAQSVGQTTGWIYPDPVPGSGIFYYWVRFISAGGKEGPFNAVSGTAGEASLDPSYLIDVLAAEGDPNALLYEIPEPTIINGVPVPAGLYMRDIYVANGSISNLKLGNAAVDDAKIANLSAAKVTFGEMHGDRIQANTMNADRLTVNTLAARLAVITSAYVGTANIHDLAVSTGKIANLSVNSGKIADLAVIAAKIADLNVTNAKIAELAVTEGKIGNLAVTNAKIRDAAITAAKIGDAQITTAKIGNAQVDTLRIAGNAVTVHGSAEADYAQVASRDIDVTIYLPYAAEVTMIAYVGMLAQVNSAVLMIDGIVTKTLPIWVYNNNAWLGNSSSTVRYVGAGAHTFKLRQTSQALSGQSVPPGALTVLVAMR